MIISDIIFMGYVDPCTRRDEVFHDCSNITRCGTKIIVHILTTKLCFFPPTSENGGGYFYAYLIKLDTM